METIKAFFSPDAKERNVNKVSCNGVQVSRTIMPETINNKIRFITLMSCMKVWLVKIEEEVNG